MADRATQRSNSTRSSSKCCILEFDGASKGNPGKAGAGAVLRSEDGTVVSRLREGLGTATNNVAEYQGLILGMKAALKRGFRHIRIQGDSQLVFKQVQDEWQVRQSHIADLCKKAKELMAQFDSCEFCPVGREFNSDADREANLAVDLRDGEVYDSSEDGEANLALNLWDVSGGEDHGSSASDVAGGEDHDSGASHESGVEDSDSGASDVSGGEGYDFGDSD